MGSRGTQMASRHSKTIKKNITGLLFVLPALFLIILFSFKPIIENIYLSFQSWNLVQPARFVGLENYERLFNGREFRNALEITLKYLVFYVPLNLIPGFFIAILLTANTKMNRWVRTLSFTPNVTSMVAMSAVWLYIYHPQYGTLNSFLSIFGIEPMRWLNDPQIALYSLIIVAVWKKLGFVILIYLSGLLAIPRELYEAAEMDGATVWQKIRHVTFPLVTGTSYMILILLVIEAFQVFTQVDVMTQGGPARSTTTLLAHMYYKSFTEFQYGYGSAVSIFILLITVGSYLILNRLEKYVNYDL